MRTASSSARRATAEGAAAGPPRMDRFALIGAGRIGRIHAANLVTLVGAELACVADTDASAAETLARLHGARVVPALVAIADDSIDALLIASSTDTHADLIEAGARAGKPIFCEKPLDLDLERAARCLAVAEQAGILLHLGFNRRYDPGFARIRREIAAGGI